MAAPFAPCRLFILSPSQVLGLSRAPVPRGLLAPNLYVPGEIHSSVLPRVPHWTNGQPFFGAAPLHCFFPSYLQGNNPTCPSTPPPWCLLKCRENRSIF